MNDSILFKKAWKKYAFQIKIKRQYNWLKILDYRKTIKEMFHCKYEWNYKLNKSKIITYSGSNPGFTCSPRNCMGFLRVL